MLEIPLCFRDDYTGKSKKGNQVRNGHETVYNIRKRPDFFKLHESASCDNGDIAQAVRSNPFDTHKVYEAAFTVIVPAENGGESEKCQRNRQKDRRDSTITMAESGLCKSCTVGIPQPCTGNNDSQTGQRTDNNSVDKGACHGNKTLFSRPFRFCRCRHDWRGTQAGFIGKKAAGDTASHGKHNARTGKSAGCRRTFKSAVKNESQRMGQFSRKYNKKSHRDNKIKNSHGRNYFFRCF